MQRWKTLVAMLVVGTAMVAALRAQVGKQEASGRAMTEAATAFLNSLTPQQALQVKFGYDDAERLNWHFIPRVRKGLPIRDLEGEPLRRAQALLQSGLSPTGYAQTMDIMGLEEILYLLEPGERAERRERRDPRKYYFSVFGTPELTGTWGWRIEGHHISLNFSVKDGQVVSSTPEFFGANPGSIEAGPGRSIRVLAPEEDLARQILKSASPEQLKVLWVDKKAPDDLRGGGVAQPENTPAVGLKAADMTADQKTLLAQVMSEYLKNMPSDVEQKRRDEVNAAGVDNLYFAWWGDQERNERHYYRIQGPTFIIEYNNTQNQANHVHSMWRQLAGDFNIPVAKKN
ncbi:MAG: DUF3500 domain-containing protein [Planctomycetota bacterium]